MEQTAGITTLPVIVIFAVSWKPVDFCLFCGILYDWGDKSPFYSGCFGIAGSEIAAGLLPPDITFLVRSCLGTSE